MVSAKALASGPEPMASTGSIVGVADAAHGWFNARFSQTLGVSDRDVLASPVRCPLLGHASMPCQASGLPQAAYGGQAGTDQIAYRFMGRVGTLHGPQSTSPVQTRQIDRVPTVCLDPVPRLARGQRRGHAGVVAQLGRWRIHIVNPCG